MSKYMRYQPIISRNSESELDEDNWLNRIEKTLQKEAVQSKKIDQSMFEQINNIMNGKSKYPSVQAAVDDMMSRSGVTAYLDKLNKTSKENNSATKTASDDNKVIDKKIPIEPIVFQKCPGAKNTLANIIRSSRGHLPVPAIIARIKAIHDRDVSDVKDWDNDDLIRAVSRANLEEKSKGFEDTTNQTSLGLKDEMNDKDIDPSNSDAFHGLNPVKF
jgi:hypothetical protein